jgi:hypothetical protein
MFGRKTDKSLGPSANHRFIEPSDPRWGLAAAGVHDGLQQAPALALTDASLRVPRCAMAGCGKTRNDAIHEPAE